RLYLNTIFMFKYIMFLILSPLYPSLHFSPLLSSPSLSPLLSIPLHPSLLPLPLSSLLHSSLSLLSLPLSSLLHSSLSVSPGGAFFKLGERGRGVGGSSSGSISTVLLIVSFMSVRHA